MVIVYYNFTYGHLQIIQALLYQTNWRLQWCNGRDYHPCICRFAEVTDSKYIQCKFITSPFFNMNKYLTIFPPCPFIQIFSWFYPDFIKIFSNSLYFRAKTEILLRQDSTVLPIFIHPIIQKPYYYKLCHSVILLNTVQ